MTSSGCTTGSRPSGSPMSRWRSRGVAASATTPSSRRIIASPYTGEVFTNRNLRCRLQCPDEPVDVIAVDGVATEGEQAADPADALRVPAERQQPRLVHAVH